MSLIYITMDKKKKLTSKLIISLIFFFLHQTYFSEISSNIFINLAAKPKRLYSGATVKAVTWPCHRSADPSAFPITKKNNMLIIIVHLLLIFNYYCNLFWFLMYSTCIYLVNFFYGTKEESNFITVKPL